MGLGMLTLVRVKCCGHSPPEYVTILVRLVSAVVSSTPLYSVTCLHFQRNSAHIFNTKEHKQYHGNRNSKVV